MNNLISRTEIERTFNVNEYQVRMIVADLPIAYTMKQGRGNLHLYALDLVQEAHAKWLERQAEKVPAAPAPQPEPLPVDLSPVLDSLGRVEAMVEDGFDACAKRHEQLVSANSILFHKVQDLEGVVKNLLGVIRELKVTEVQVAAQTPAPAPAPAPAPTPAPTPAPEPKAVVTAIPSMPASQSSRPTVRVGIIGLLPSQQQTIEREFRECFDLRFWQSQDSHGRSFAEGVKSCDHVFAMVNFINHGVEPTVAASKGKLHRVRGSVSRLRDELTELFANGVAA